MLSPRKRRSTGKSAIAQPTKAAVDELEDKVSKLKDEFVGLSQSMIALTKSLEDIHSENQKVMFKLNIMSIMVVGVSFMAIAIDLQAGEHSALKTGVTAAIGLLGVLYIFRYNLLSTSTSLLSAKQGNKSHPPPASTIVPDPMRVSKAETGSPEGIKQSFGSSNIATKAPDGTGLLDVGEIRRKKPDGWVVLNDKELSDIQALRARLCDLPQPHWRSLNFGDSCLVRFLRARKQNVEAAEEMFRNAHAWFTENKPETVLDSFSPPSMLEQYGTGGICGVDRDGCPVLYDPVGLVDPPGMLKHVTPEEVLQFHIWKEENTTLRLLRHSTNEKEHYKHLVIMDLQGLSRRHWHQPGLQLFQKISHVGDNCYPERLKAILIINAPRIFGALWMVVKHFFDPGTKEKIQIFSGCPSEVLKTYISPDQLPKYLGGDLVVDGNPYCSPPILRGGRVVT